ncbi:MAG: SPOR domain-containing protein [Magnetococcus sp. WYHC-3]
MPQHGIFALWLLLSLWMVAPASARQSDQQPAFITNAYFSDGLIREDNVLKPNAVISVLRAHQSGIVGYFIMDVLTTVPGRHIIEIDILDKEGHKLADMAYDPIIARGGEDDALYTVVSAVAGAFPPGWLFFKVYDRVDQRPRIPLSTFNIMTRVADPSQQTARTTDSDSDLPPEIDDPFAETERFSLPAPQRDAPASTQLRAGQHNPPLPPDPELQVPQVVQAGFFSNHDNADALVARIQGLGLPAFADPVPSGPGRTSYRVLVGPFVAGSDGRRAAIQVQREFGIRTPVLLSWDGGDRPGAAPPPAAPLGNTRPAPASQVGSAAVVKQPVAAVPPRPVAPAPSVEAASPPPAEAASAAAAVPRPHRATADAPPRKVVWCGEFPTLAAAESLKRRLEPMGWPVLLRPGVGGNTFEVLAGPFENWTRAGQAAVRIQNEGGVESPMLRTMELADPGLPAAVPATPPSSVVASAPKGLGRAERSLAPPSASDRASSRGGDAVMPAVGKVSKAGTVLPREVPAPSVAEVVVAPGVVPHAAGAAGMAGGGYRLMLGTFRKTDLADRVLEQVKALGLPVVQEPVRLEQRTYLRVIAGPFASRGEALTLSAEIEERTGLHGFEVLEP